MVNVIEPSAATKNSVDAIHRLAIARKERPDLGTAEAEARIELAAAIMAMDAADKEAAGGAVHSLVQQAEVERATRAYAQHLANLVRGEVQV